MKHWCYPYHQVKTHQQDDGAISDLANIRDFSPCGSLLVKSLKSVTHSQWIIKVNRAFGMNVTILDFQLDNSESCDFVYIAIHFKKNIHAHVSTWCSMASSELRFCGSRPYWNTYLPYSTIKVLLLQFYVIQVPHFYLLYEIYDLTFHREVSAFTPSFLTITGSLYIQFKGISYYWLLKSWIGARLSAQIWGCEWTRSIVTIFDGPTDDIKLASLENCFSDNGYNVTSTIHMMLIKHKWQTYNLTNLDKDFINIHFTFMMIGLTYLSIHKNQTTLVKSIIHPSSPSAISAIQYHVSSKQEHVSLKVQMHVKEFHGYTKPNCIYGGFMMISDFFFDHDGDLKADDFGPFCDIRPGRTLLGTNSELILPGNFTYLYFYAFSTYFHLHLRITLTGTTCAGIINICRFCNVKIKDVYVTETLSAHCVGESRVAIYQRQNTCVRIQSMLTSKDVVCEFNFEQSITAGYLQVVVAYFSPNIYTSFVAMASETCKQKFLIVAKYYDKPSEKKIFTTHDARLSIVPRFMVIQHIYQCRYAEFSYSVQLINRENRTECVKYTNVTDFVDKSHCGEFIFAAHRLTPLYRFLLKVPVIFYNITSRAYHRLHLHYTSVVSTQARSHDQLHLLQDSSAIAIINEQQFSQSHVSIHR